MLQTPEIHIVVPKIHTAIKNGSAIVTVVESEGSFCYFEGNIYGSSLMGTVEQKCFHAASRMIHRYPTIARVFLHPCQYQIVGIWQHETESILWRDHSLFVEWSKGNFPSSSYF